MPNADLSDAILARIERISTTSKQLAADRARARNAPTAQDARLTIQEFTERAGVKRIRIITPLQLLYRRNLLTIRQLSAGQSLVDDAEIALGVDQPPDDTRTRLSREPDGRMVAMLAAANRVAKARQAAEVEHPTAWAMVGAVALDEHPVSRIAGNDRSRTVAPFMLALRVGLDAVGDSYGHTSPFVHTKVLVDGIPLGEIEVTEDANGNARDGGTHVVWRSRSITYRGITLPWISEAEAMGRLYQAAKTRIAAWPQHRAEI